MAKRIQAPLTAKAGGIHGKRQRRNTRRTGESMRTAEKRLVTVRLPRLVRKALFGERGRQGPGQAPVQVERAIRCYLNDRGSGVAGWPYPDFLRAREPTGGVRLELAIEDSLWRSLEEEAESQGVSLSQMLEHALLYFVAALSAGRVTQPILDEKAGTKQRDRS
jgi:hypothetical protein